MRRRWSEGTNGVRGHLASQALKTAALGAAAGAVILGGGGRIVMRLLAHSIDRPGVFSLGGSLEVVAYGAIVGAAGGVLAAFVRLLPLGFSARAAAIGLLTYAGTLLTLPDHIADTARPFADRMMLVHALFGATFLLYAVALEVLSGKGPFAKLRHNQ